MPSAANSNSSLQRDQLRQQLWFHREQAAGLSSQSGKQHCEQQTSSSFQSSSSFSSQQQWKFLLPAAASFSHLQP
jgi:hypothetical protein